MAKKKVITETAAAKSDKHGQDAHATLKHEQDAHATLRGKPSAVVGTRVIYCGDNPEQLKRLSEGCVDLIYIDPPFNSNRNYEVFWGETKEKRAFEDRHASTQEVYYNG